MTNLTVSTATSMSDVDPYDDQIRAILRDHGRLKTDAQSIDGGADLFAAGMTSHASVNVMLALENAFDIEFPDHMLRREVFASIRSIRSALKELRTA